MYVYINIIIIYALLCVCISMYMIHLLITALHWQNDFLEGKTFANFISILHFTGNLKFSATKICAIRLTTLYYLHVSNL